ncbi:MAG: hypothetical protein AUI17_01885 [Acidobacteriales bacterium 13_2_20CM_2_55_5]|nr:MAG: hypothetical protein AUI17_01885 [Acidobacteriales bacterium 13_2_20CM_2_55_5]
MPTFVRRWIRVGLVLTLIGHALGQGGATGAITGTVEDPSGAVLAGADVRILNQDTGALSRTLKTDANGSFTATLLPVGSYTVSVTSSGFREGKFPDIAVRVTETTRMTVNLRPSSVQEKVEVQAQVQNVDTTAATTGQAIEARNVRNLPLATQNFQQLLTLSTGAQSELNASAQLGRGDVRIQVNGQREDNNNYLIEGISATDYNVAELTNTPLPSPDVVQEFKVPAWTQMSISTSGVSWRRAFRISVRTSSKTFTAEAWAVRWAGRPSSAFSSLTIRERASAAAFRRARSSAPLFPYFRLLVGARRRTPRPWSTHSFPATPM